jgi:L-aminopeptidase/D-esterase-like protein
VDVRGSSPGTRETARLAPTASIRHTDAVLLTGGSAFGLAAADGVVRYLEERGVGLAIGDVKIPLVSAAVLFDLMNGRPDVRPDSRMGHEAASNAESGAFEQGSVGAGTGATIGKVLGLDRAMKGGVGSASFRLEGGLVVGAIAAVNAFGEVREQPGGAVIAGPRMDDGTFGDTVELLPEAASRLRWGQNTTLCVVATNARLSKTEITKVAQMAHDGLARTIYPVHTTVDGDVAFAASLGEVESAPDVVGSWGARAVAEAVMRAARNAKSLGGVPGLAG